MGWVDVKLEGCLHICNMQIALKLINISVMPKIVFKEEFSWQNFQIMNFYILNNLYLAFFFWLSDNILNMVI